MVGDLAGTTSKFPYPIFNNPDFKASAHFRISQSGQIWPYRPVSGWKAWARTGSAQERCWPGSR